LGWAELSPVDVSITASRLWRTGKYYTLVAVCLQGHYLSYSCSRLSGLVGFLIEHASVTVTSVTHRLLMTILSLGMLSESHLLGVVLLSHGRIG